MHFFASCVIYTLQLLFTIKSSLCCRCYVLKVNYHGNWLNISYPFYAVPLFMCVSLKQTLCVYSGFQDRNTTEIPHTHSHALGLTVDLQRTEAFWEIELMEVDSRWATLSLLRRTDGFHQNYRLIVSEVISVWPLLPPAPKCGTPTVRSDLWCLGCRFSAAGLQTPSAASDHHHKWSNNSVTEWWEQLISLAHQIKHQVVILSFVF